MLGGDRDPASRWDFADVPVPALPAVGAARNSVIDIGDVLAVIAWVGATDDGPPTASGRDYDADGDGNQMDDGAQYDRSPSATVGKPWRLGAPDGSISIGDALAVLTSVGDSCF
jgi:hypothetical protein